MKVQGSSTYIIGREPDPSGPRIVLEDKSISRTHGCISIIGDASYLIEDLGSANGTYVREKGGWRRIQRTEIGPEDEVRLGSYITSVGALVQRAIHAPGRVKFERDPDSGEIVKKSR